MDTRKSTGSNSAKFKERKADFKTFSGLPVKIVYTQDDMEGIDYLKEIGSPG